MQLYHHSVYIFPFLFSFFHCEGKPIYSPRLLLLPSEFSPELYYSILSQVLQLNGSSWKDTFYAFLVGEKETRTDLEF